MRTLERLGVRKTVLNQNQLAEAISLIIWDAELGKVHPRSPAQDSILRIESITDRLYDRYVERYKGLPPHNVARM